MFWVIALGAGGAAAYLIHSYVKTNAKAAPSLSRIAVAAMTLDLATTLQPEHIQMVAWPDSVVAPDAIRDPKDAIGRVLVNKAVKGQLLLESMLASRESGKGLAALIPPTMRAVAVAVDDVVGVAGFIHPEDRVDVIVTIRPNKPDNAETTSKVILQNVVVLTVGKEIEIKDNARNKPMPVTVATLLVSPEDSERLALAANQGRLLLSLRGRADTERPATAGMVASALLGDTPPRPEVAEAAPSPVRTVRRRTRAVSTVKEPENKEGRVEKKESVEILRGDRFERRKFDVKETP